MFMVGPSRPNTPALVLPVFTASVTFFGWIPVVGHNWAKDNGSYLETPPLDYNFVNSPVQLIFVEESIRGLGFALVSVAAMLILARTKFEVPIGTFHIGLALVHAGFTWLGVLGFEGLLFGTYVGWYYDLGLTNEFWRGNQLLASALVPATISGWLLGQKLRASRRRESAR